MLRDLAITLCCLPAALGSTQARIAALLRGPPPAPRAPHAPLPHPTPRAAPPAQYTEHEKLGRRVRALQRRKQAVPAGRFRYDEGVECAGDSHPDRPHAMPTAHRFLC